MVHSIRQRLVAGVAFLLILLLGVTGVGIFHLIHLKRETEGLEKQLQQWVAAREHDSGVAEPPGNQPMKSNVFPPGILRQSQDSMHRADTALTQLVICAALIFLIGISFTYNFPGSVTRPLPTLAAGIAELKRGNYRHRVHLDNRDEFGLLAESLNGLAANLEAGVAKPDHP